VPISTRGTRAGHRIHKRRYVERPENEWVKTERPELAIVDRETWERVQARHASAVRDHGERKRSASPHMLSGFP